MTGTASIIRGNALDLALADSSVDLIVTSPPYFGLRSYQDGGEHYEGQIGDEATPAEFVDALVAATAEMVRVLKPSGSIWVNLGDKYSQSANQWGGSRRGHQGVLAGTKADDATRFGVAAAAGAPQMGRPKSLIGIPWRYALRCIDDLGLILRAEVIWSKPNGLPESVTDRVRRSHETWFHFTKSPRYFSAVDEIREEHQHPDVKRTSPKHEAAPFAVGQPAHTTLGTSKPNPLGKLPGSVWTIPTQPLRVPDHLGIDHFAAFPMEWPRRIIRGWSPAGVCVECGERRRPVTHKKPMEWRPGPKAGGYELEGTSRKVVSGTMLSASETTITGYACACVVPPPQDATGLVCHKCGCVGVVHHYDCIPPTQPAVVLDPFGGTGTTALVAKALGRHGISNDMSADYCRLATWRTNDEAELARAMQVEKPAEQVKGQASLLDLIDGGAA